MESLHWKILRSIKCQLISFRKCRCFTNGKIYFFNKKLKKSQKFASFRSTDIIRKTFLSFLYKFIGATLLPFECSAAKFSYFVKVEVLIMLTFNRDKFVQNQFNNTMKFDSLERNNICNSTKLKHVSTTCSAWNNLLLQQT